MESYIPAHTCEPVHTGFDWFFNNDVEAVEGLRSDPVSEPFATRRMALPEEPPIEPLPPSLSGE